jgi:hypothetical protein
VPRGSWNVTSSTTNRGAPRNTSTFSRDERYPNSQSATLSVRTRETCLSQVRTEAIVSATS